MSLNNIINNNLRKVYYVYHLIIYLNRFEFYIEHFQNTVIMTNM